MFFFTKKLKHSPEALPLMNGNLFKIFEIQQFVYCVKNFLHLISITGDIAQGSIAQGPTVYKFF